MNTQSALLGVHPLLPLNLVRGQGCHLFDAQGRDFVDLESGSWAAILGHAHPAITRALCEQAVRLVHLNVSTPNHLAGEAAEMLLRLTGLAGGKCSFLSSGSEAVEFAVQLSQRATGRSLHLCLEGSYLSACGSSAWKRPSEWCLVPWKGVDGDPEEFIKDLPFERIASFVFEPGGGSPFFAKCPPPALVEALAARVQAAGGLVVVNEVTTGFGRTGTWFGHQHYALRPDLIAVGKGLGNGYPVSAVVVRSGVAATIEKIGYRHAQSHQNNPLGCAVALAVLRELEQQNWIEKGAQGGALLLARLRDLAAKKNSVLALRGRGLLLALELKAGGRHNGKTLQAALLEKGIIVGAYPPDYPAGTGIRLDPPLLLGPSEIEQLAKALDALLD